MGRLGLLGLALLMVVNKARAVPNDSAEKIDVSRCFMGGEKEAGRAELVNRQAT